MKYARMPIEVESPEEFGYGNIRYNLSESSIADRTLSDFNLHIPNLKLLYAEHRGSDPLRTLIASDGAGLTSKDVLITTGAAGALFIIATALLSAHDHLVVVRPNYATNLETPRAIGCETTIIDLAFEQGFRIDVDQIASAIKANTRVVSVTSPHNPTGVMMTLDELHALVALTAERGCHLLVDETYRDLSLTGALPLASTLGEHVISVSSLSKAYGAPGLRLGWIISKNPGLQERFLAAKEQISICGSVIDEWVGEQILAHRDSILQPILEEMRSRHTLVSQWIASESMLEWVEPSGGVVCFPRMREQPSGGTDSFYKRLLQTHGTYVGPGHWFEMPDTYFRLGYGWPTREELEGGLRSISEALHG